MKEYREHERFNMALNGLCPKITNKPEVELNNFSKEGLGITCKSAIPEGVEVEIELMSPDGSAPAIAKGEIVWLSDGDRFGGQHYKMGIKLKKEEKGWIFNFLHKKWLRRKNEGNKQ